jgi:hypothetical protein
MREMRRLGGVHPLAGLVAKNLASVGSAPLSGYAAILGHSLKMHEPPFFSRSFGRRYFELARRADWFAHSLVANSALEGYGARQIWMFANRVADHAPEIRCHALDESRHSRMFISMLRLVFPGIAIEGDAERELRAMQPGFSVRFHPPIEPVEGISLLRGEALLDELIQVHITEIRALVLQYLLRSVALAYAPSTSHAAIKKLSSLLVRDEGRHIGYTADIFERETSCNREFLFDAFERRLKEFNDLTLVELERDRITA